jgi:hypothetical protein
MPAFTPTLTDPEQTTTTIPGVVLARTDAPPTARPPGGGYGAAWLLRTPLRAGGWLALALLWTIPVGLALAFWLTASPRRAAVTAAAGLLATGLHR